MVLSAADLWLIFSKSRRKSETRERYVCVGEWRICGLPSGSPTLVLVPRGRPSTHGWSSCTFRELPAFPRAEKAGPQVPASSAGAGARGGHPGSSPPRPTCPTLPGRLLLHTTEASTRVAAPGRLGPRRWALSPAAEATQLAAETLLNRRGWTNSFSRVSHAGLVSSHPGLGRYARGGSHPQGPGPYRLSPCWRQASRATLPGPPSSPHIHGPRGRGPSLECGRRASPHRFSPPAPPSPGAPEEQSPQERLRDAGASPSPSGRWKPTAPEQRREAHGEGQPHKPTCPMDHAHGVGGAGSLESGRVASREAAGDGPGATGGGSASSRSHRSDKEAACAVKQRKASELGHRQGRSGSGRRSLLADLVPMGHTGASQAIR